MPMQLEHHFVETTGCRLHYVEAGKADAPLIVFLHGFPEYAECWLHQLKYFSQAYRVIAPDLPGYNLSGKPEEADFYAVPNLISVLAEFIITVSQDKPVILVAHDWGGAIAWPLVAFHPQLFSQLIILNAAHPSTFTREMRDNPEQRRRSHYIGDLIASEAAAKLVSNNFAFLRELCLNHRSYPVSDAEVSEYIDAWSQPGAVDGMLRYYRAMPQLVLEDDSSALAHIRIPNIRINVPTLVVWGMQDQAFVPAVLEGLEEYVSELSVRRLPDATHWLHHEFPDTLNSLLEDFILTT